MYWPGSTAGKEYSPTEFVDRVAGDAVRFIDQRDGHAWDHALRVFDAAAHAALERLCPHSRGRESDEHR